MTTLGMLAAPRGVNAQLLKALLTHSRFDEIALFIGETADLATLEKLTEDWDVAEERLAAYSLWQLPELLARGRLDVLHHATHGDRLIDLLAVRNRHAGKPVPVTGQTHSLSSPRAHQELSRQLLIPPSPGDALFCASTASRGVIEQSFERLHAEAKRAGFSGPLPTWDLPVVPLGVEFDALQGGERAKTRNTLGVPDGAVMLTCLARFAEIDEIDLLPLVRVLERLVREPSAGAPPIYLLLAGAR